VHRSRSIVHLARLRLPDVVSHWRGLVQSQPSLFLLALSRAPLLCRVLAREGDGKRLILLCLLCVFKHAGQAEPKGLTEQKRSFFLCRPKVLGLWFGVGQPWHRAR
jgi:hypothetical protein